MDNPGLAFLKQMHDPKVYGLVYGKSSLLYKEVMTMRPYRHKPTSITVFLGEEKQISIERHYFVPPSINAIRMYFLVFVLLRDRFICFMYALFLQDWDHLTHQQKSWFENKRKYYKDFSDSFQIMIGKGFMHKIKFILKRCKFHIDDNSESYRKTVEMTRHELISEFEILMGRSLDDQVDFINSDDPKPIQVDTNRDPDIWLDSIELAAEDKRLFNLGVVESIRVDAKNTRYFGKEREDLMKWVGQDHVVINLNPKWIMPLAMRLKKCIKIPLDIKASKNVTLNDCLSKTRGITSLLPQRRVPAEREPMVLSQMQGAPKCFQENLFIAHARDPDHPPETFREARGTQIRHFQQNQRLDRLSSGQLGPEGVLHPGQSKLGHVRLDRRGQPLRQNGRRTLHFSGAQLREGKVDQVR